MEYRFSVLMSIYDGEKVDNLRDSLESLVNQTLLPSEIVVVLDGKIRQELLKVLKKYKVKIVKLKSHVGLSKALSIGIDYCSYDLVARMDTDDICVKDRFEKQINRFKSNDKLVMVGGQILEFDSYSLKKKRIVPIDSKNIYKFSKKRNPFNHVTVMFKKDVIKNVGGYENLAGFEDYYLWIKLLRNNYYVENIDDVLVNVRFDNESVKRRGSFKYLRYIYDFERRIYKEKYISFFRYGSNLFVRMIVAIVPIKVRGVFYNKILRK